VGDDLRRAKPPQTCCGNRMSHASRSQSNQSIRQNRRPSRYRDRLLAQRNALEFPFRANEWPREIEVARVRNDGSTVPARCGDEAPPAGSPAHAQRRDPDGALVGGNETAAGAGLDETGGGLRCPSHPIRAAARAWAQGQR
jgi:hypothetical protein